MFRDLWSAPAPAAADHPSAAVSAFTPALSESRNVSLHFGIRLISTWKIGRRLIHFGDGGRGGAPKSRNTQRSIQAVRDRQEKLALRKHAQGCEDKRDDLPPGGDGQGERSESLRISANTFSSACRQPTPPGPSTICCRRAKPSDQLSKPDSHLPLPRTAPTLSRCRRIDAYVLHSAPTVCCRIEPFGRTATSEM